MRNPRDLFRNDISESSSNEQGIGTDFNIPGPVSVYRTSNSQHPALPSSSTGSITTGATISSIFSLPSGEPEHPIPFGAAI